MMIKSGPKAAERLAYLLNKHRRLVKKRRELDELRSLSSGWDMVKLEWRFNSVIRKEARSWDKIQDIEPFLEKWVFEYKGKYYSVSEFSEEELKKILKKTDENMPFSTYDELLESRRLQKVAKIIKKYLNETKQTKDTD